MAEGRDSCETAITTPAAKANIGPHLRVIPPAEAGHAGAWAGPRSPRPYPVVPQVVRGGAGWSAMENRGEGRVCLVPRVKR